MDYEPEDYGTEDYVEVDEAPAGVDQMQPEPEKPLPVPTVLPESSHHVEESSSATKWIQDAVKAVTGWIADHPLLVVGAGYLVVGYIVKPKWLPWSLFKD